MLCLGINFFLFILCEIFTVNCLFSLEKIFVVLLETQEGNALLQKYIPLVLSPPDTSKYCNLVTKFIP